MLHSADPRHHIKIIEFNNINRQTVSVAETDQNKNFDLNQIQVNSTNNNNGAQQNKAVKEIENGKSSIEKTQFAIATETKSNPLTNGKKPNDNQLIDTTNNATVKETIFPNVFDDNIFEFIESRRQVNDSKSKINKLDDKTDSKLNDASWQQKQTAPLSSSAVVENWRQKSNEPIATQPINQPFSFGNAHLYAKFPHLDPNKVKDPLKATPMSVVDGGITTTTTTTTTANPTKVKSPLEGHPIIQGLDKLLLEVNQHNAVQKSAPFKVVPQRSNTAQPNPIRPPGMPNNNPLVNPNPTPLLPLFPLLFDPPNQHSPFGPLFNVPPQTSAFQKAVIPPNYPLNWLNVTNLTSPRLGASPLMPNQPQQQQANGTPGRVRSTLKKTDSLNSLTSLPATFNTKPKSSKAGSSTLEKSSSVTDLNTSGKRDDNKKTMKNNLKSKSHPSSFIGK